MPRPSGLYVQVTMLSLKWGDVLSTLLPGAIVVFALAPSIPQVQRWFDRIDQIGPGVALLMASVLVGEVLGAITRITWESKFLVRRHPAKDILPYLRENNQNVALYERGVQSSYKYVTFYANFAWALLILLAINIFEKPKAVVIVSLVALIGLLLRASYVQWTYFVNYQTKVFGPRNDTNTGQRSSTRNEGQIHIG